MFLKLAIGALVILAMIVGMIRVKRHLDGDSGGSLFGGRRRREARASREELEDFVQAYRRERAGAADRGTEPASAHPPAAATDPTAASAAGPAPKARPAYLDGAKKVMYLVLRSGLPDHHVFANCGLADLLEPGSQIPPALIQARLDLVVCRSDLRVVAVVDVGAPGHGAQRGLEARLAAAGIRYVRVVPPALPRPAQVRALIYPG